MKDIWTAQKIYSSLVEMLRTSFSQWWHHFGVFEWEFQCRPLHFLNKENFLSQFSDEVTFGYNQNKEVAPPGEAQHQKYFIFR